MNEDVESAKLGKQSMPGSRGHFPAVPESRLREPVRGPDWDLAPKVAGYKALTEPRKLERVSTTSDFTSPMACQAIPHY